MFKLKNINFKKSISASEIVKKLIISLKGGF